ncbi:trimeric intracellular cation channel family protein [Parvularcula sp. ZS-1/3]|uniref:Trimeric intracellular cation channel family protein n=1 Tax=Parvularcula mediterranea TaxID=2732508 RepID=A0A7Y3RJY9_9PROT|nr:trimeric intracellular cation channel family protein [Parvularcula mediterranea]NNU15060.1 trimeric intracellular cation channel family protein [Parvularcula mediterranea]
MSPELLLLLADRAGTFVFALSGGVAAVRLRMDLFGVVMLSFLPAVGGGTLRDLLLDQPVFWLEDTVVLGFAAAGGLVAFFAASAVDAFKPLRWADAMGLALFAITGAAKAAELGYGLVVVLLMGTITATFGGLLRDVVANREPLIFKEDIYATAAMFGALIYAILVASPATQTLAFAGGCVAAFLLRGAAIIWKLELPKPRG